MGKTIYYKETPPVWRRLWISRLHIYNKLHTIKGAVINMFDAILTMNNKQEEECKWYEVGNYNVIFYLNKPILVFDNIMSEYYIFSQVALEIKSIQLNIFDQWNYTYILSDYVRIEEEWKVREVGDMLC